MIQRVNAFTYLGTWITTNIDQRKEIKTFTEILRSTLVKLKKFHVQLETAPLRVPLLELEHQIKCI